jgi:hypothetical protein
MEAMEHLMVHKNHGKFLKSSRLIEALMKLADSLIHIETREFMG